ncbi:MAG: indolepyruvate ferredoxin oxidoreductase subunit alpha [Erysipelotrichaceae bacterium]
MKYKVSFDEGYCKGCELCVAFCPKKILKISDRFNQAGYPVSECIDESACIGCLSCVRMCPDSVITIASYD